MEGVHRIIWLMIVINFISLAYTLYTLIEHYSTTKLSFSRLAGKNIISMYNVCKYISNYVPTYISALTAVHCTACTVVGYITL